MSTIAGARVSGQSGDAAVFVHGVGSTAAIWDYQLRELGSRYRCFAVELRGNGTAKPDAEPSAITREGFVDDVLAVADAAGAQRFHFVGCSLGGVVGFELWRRAPHRVASMTLAGTFAAYEGGAQYAQGVIESVRAAGTMERFASERVAKLAMPPGRRADETLAQMFCKTVDCYIASTCATWTGDYREMLGSISVPVMAVCGERDPVAPFRYSEEIARGVPGARLEVIAGAGHVVNADAPEAFNGALESFWQSIR